MSLLLATIDSQAMVPLYIATMTILLPLLVDSQYVKIRQFVKSILKHRLG